MYKILHHMYKIWIYLDLGTFRHVVKMTSLTSRPTEAGGSVDKKCLLWHSLGPTKNAKNRFCEHLSQYHCIFPLIFPFVSQNTSHKYVKMIATKMINIDAQLSSSRQSQPFLLFVPFWWVASKKRPLPQMAPLGPSLAYR